MTDPKPITYLPVLSSDECLATWRSLQGLRAYWTLRGANGRTQFHTFGLATYLDVVPSGDVEATYYGLVASSNRRLYDAFGPLLIAVRDALRAHLSSRVELTKEHALPGFHIFVGSSILRSSTALPHVDAQYRVLRWSDVPDPETALSFTLPLVLPRVGAGLAVWPDPPESPVASPSSSGADGGSHVVFPYLPGLLCVQRGLVRHRSAHFEGITNEDVRVTLQGHGIGVDGRYVLYW